MEDNNDNRLLFVINSVSGSDNIPWQETISNYFTGNDFIIDFFMLGEEPEPEALKEYLQHKSFGKVIAVGGDGTVSLVAKAIAGTVAVLGILPAGSANGMAKELNISEDPEEAMAIVAKGSISDCDAININENICLHLSDIGLNAQLIKYFDEGKLRGKAGYARVLIKTLWHSQKITVTIQSDGKPKTTTAFMVVLANASKYGTGAVINPTGKINDGIFEVIIIHKLSVRELIKMIFRPGHFDPKKIEIFTATSAKITMKKKAHFQVDGEYHGKVNQVEAVILPNYLRVTLPQKR